MAREQYMRQVELLVRTLPYIARHEAFALKGGTAINLFYREMPRLSVDIDLTYVPIEDRETTLKGIDVYAKTCCATCAAPPSSGSPAAAITTRAFWFGRAAPKSKSRRRRSRAERCTRPNSGL